MDCHPLLNCIVRRMLARREIAALRTVLNADAFAQRDGGLRAASEVGPE